MTVSSPSTFDLINTYVHLKDGADAVPVAVGDDFWATIGTRTELHSGRLVTLFHIQSTDEWVHWEMHPAGDEIVCLLSGAIDLILQEGKRERSLELRSRAAGIIPRGVWHRAIVHTPSDIMFITRGAGTQLRPI
jgi:oxalate decarboxylase/phosphoglucose isomerase-like protein (cupin superfamily)